MGTQVEQQVGRSRGDDRARADALAPSVRPNASVTRAYQQIADDDRGTGGESRADFLGYFSLGLGLAEFLAPGVMSRVIGVKHPDRSNITTMRAMGLREIGHGVAILSNQHPERAVWSRVAGDALDLMFLGRTFANPDNDRGRTLFATINVLAVAALDVMTARQLSMQPATQARTTMDEGVIRTKRSITVRRPVEEVYAFWRDFENLPRFMRHLESVRITAEGRSHWTALAPAGQTVEWDAETTADVPNERIAWRSLPGASVDNGGEVRFAPAPGGRGTEVRVTLYYDPPFGKLGSKLAMLFREEPGQQVQDSLRHLKQVLETGEVVLSDATKQRGPHPARPDTKPVQL